MTITVSAPATTANLGPGFDCFALALHPRCQVTAEPADDWRVEHVGSEVLTGGADDAVLRGAQRVSSQPLHLKVHSSIPIGKGLGSSAAALVAGVATGLASQGDVDDAEVFAIASEMEGHPDQVGAAVYGGLVLITPDGLPTALTAHPDLRVLIAVPDQVLATEAARRAVPGELPLDVVIRSLSRVSALTAGLLTGDRHLLSMAAGDEVHEKPRAPLSPVVGALIEVALGAGAWHAARSGAGPSVAAFCSEVEVAAVRAAFEGAGASVIDGPIEQTGLRVMRATAPPV